MSRAGQGNTFDLLVVPVSRCDGEFQWRLSPTQLPSDLTGRTRALRFECCDVGSLGEREPQSGFLSLPAAFNRNEWDPLLMLYPRLRPDRYTMHPSTKPTRRLHLT